MRPRLENWAIYLGRAYGILKGEHPSGIRDGHAVMTTPVVFGPEVVDGVQIIETKSGLIYELGGPAQ